MQRPHRLIGCGAHVFLVYKFLQLTVLGKHRWQIWLLSTKACGYQGSMMAYEKQTVFFCSKTKVSDSFWQLNIVNLCTYHNFWAKNRCPGLVQKSIPPIPWENSWIWCRKPSPNWCLGEATRNHWLPLRPAPFTLCFSKISATSQKMGVSSRGIQIIQKECIFHGSVKIYQRGVSEKFRFHMYLLYNKHARVF